jgi:hypothetical protein
MRTIPHDPDDAAEVAAVQTPEGEPDAELIDPDSLPIPEADEDDPSSEAVIPE